MGIVPRPRGNSLSAAATHSDGSEQETHDGTRYRRARLPEDQGADDPAAALAAAILGMSESLDLDTP